MTRQDFLRAHEIVHASPGVRAAARLPIINGSVTPNAISLHLNSAMPAQFYDCHSNTVGAKLQLCIDVDDRTDQGPGPRAVISHQSEGT
jgi:hypothetical protein